MGDMRLDAASNEPARQPETVAASFIGQSNPPDRPASTHRLVPPPLDQSQQRRRIRLQLLQRLALDAGNNAAHQPARAWPLVRRSLRNAPAGFRTAYRADMDRDATSSLRGRQPS